MLKEYYEIINLAKNEPTTLRGIVAKIAILNTAAGWNGHNNPDIFEVSLEREFNNVTDEMSSFMWDLNQLMASYRLAKEKYYGTDPEWKKVQLENHWCPDRLATLQTHPELEGII